MRVFFQTGGHVEVAPVFFHGNDVNGLPDGGGGWLNTAPTVAKAWFGSKNKALGYNRPGQRRTRSRNGGRCW